MTDRVHAFSRDFPAASEADWIEQVQQALKGGGLERLLKKTRDGLTIKPLYGEADFASATDPHGYPGQAPFLRGGRETPDPFLPWDIRQSFEQPDPVTANADMLRDMERGVSSVEIAVDAAGERGTPFSNKADVATLLAGIHADLATIALDHHDPDCGFNAAAHLMNWGCQQADPKRQKLAFNLDPIGTLMRTGRLDKGVDINFAILGELSHQLARQFPDADIFRVDTRQIHEAGATDAQELGVLMAHAVDTLRRLETAGYPAAQAADQIIFTLGIDANYGVGIAKIRAARLLWARIREVLNLPPAAQKIQTVSSARMMTRYDPWVNILRGTAACFAAAVGGADIVTIRAFNAPLGRPEELGRRIARNTQLIAMEESKLGQVTDPGGGAWFSETLASELAEAAWSEFQKLEGEGGLTQSLMDGAIQERIQASRAALLDEVAHKRTIVTGVNEFPLLDDYEVPVSPPIEVQSQSVAEPILGDILSAPVASSGPDTEADRLVPMHNGEVFEALRDRAENAAQAKGDRPKIFVATLGPLAEHSARLDFVRNFFAAGGIETVEAAPDQNDPATLERSFRASGSSIVVLCAADKRYQSDAETAAAKLQRAGAKRIWLAGKFETQSVDRHIFSGCNAVEELSKALSDLGVAS